MRARRRIAGSKLSSSAAAATIVARHRDSLGTPPAKPGGGDLAEQDTRPVEGKLGR